MLASENQGYCITCAYSCNRFDSLCERSDGQVVIVTWASVVTRDFNLQCTSCSYIILFVHVNLK